VGCLGLPVNQQAWIYNPGSNSWRAGPTPNVSQEGGSAADVFNTQGYMAGGGSGGSASTTVESIGACGPTPTPTPTVAGTATPTPTCAPSAFHVLIAYSDTGVPTQLQSEILAEPGVVACDLFDASVGTPTLAQLQQYQIVVPYSNDPFADDTTLGNNLADYVDGGGIVVQYGFSHYGPSQPYGVNGRWVSGNYNPYNYSTTIEFNSFGLGLPPLTATSRIS
jgi:hypothetical protein